MPYGLDVVLMQVVNNCAVVPLGVLRPHAGLASRCCTVRDGGLEERVYVLATFGGERNMSRCGHGLPLANREVVQVLGPVADTVFLNVKFLVTEWGESCGIEPSACGQVFHNKEHVIDNYAPNAHPSNAINATPPTPTPCPAWPTRPRRRLTLGSVVPMSRILVTGMSGTGKSSALAELGRRGHRVVDTDDPGWREYREY